jgi:hypothetical protein
LRDVRTPAVWPLNSPSDCHMADGRTYLDKLPEQEHPART